MPELTRGAIPGFAAHAQRSAIRFLVSPLDGVYHNKIARVGISHLMPVIINLDRKGRRFEVNP